MQTKLAQAPQKDDGAQAAGQLASSAIELLIASISGCVPQRERRADQDGQ